MVIFRAFLVAVLNDARQKIVEIKYPVKKKVFFLSFNVLVWPTFLMLSIAETFTNGIIVK